MKVLLDYHHHDLWESMELLAERLGWMLYRPIGMDWFTEGYWNHERKWHGDAIAKQYLEPWGSDGDGLRHDLSHPHRHIRLVTLEEAREMRFDIVLSSLAHNHEGFARFASENGATFGLQLGNVRFGEIDMAEDRWDLAAFGLVSGVMPLTPPKPHVVYHQEFALRPYVAPPRGLSMVGLTPDGESHSWFNHKFRISSFVQCYPESPTYSALQSIAPDAPEFDWCVYGAYGGAPLDEYAAGNISVCSQVSDAMQASDIAWHAKAWSDGFGHVIHNWFAIGRPVFGIQSYYANQLAGPLWIDGVTSIDIEHRTREEVVRELRRLRDDEDAHLRMSEAAAARFRAIVDFDAEAEAIRAMLAQVLP
jgi:hypothetical protein